MSQTMDLLIGPLIERDGSFGYDTFNSAEGLRPSFRYRRIEQARYDRRAMIVESRRNSRFTVQVCDTLGEFRERVDAVERGAAAGSGAK